MRLLARQAEDASPAKVRSLNTGKKPARNLKPGHTSKTPSQEATPASNLNLKLKPATRSQPLPAEGRSDSDFALHENFKFRVSRWGQRAIVHQMLYSRHRGPGECHSVLVLVVPAAACEIPKLPDRGPRSQMEGGCLSRNLNSNQEVQFELRVFFQVGSKANVQFSFTRNRLGHAPKLSFCSLRSLSVYRYTPREY